MSSRADSLKNLKNEVKRGSALFSSVNLYLSTLVFQRLQSVSPSPLTFYRSLLALEHPPPSFIPFKQPSLHAKALLDASLPHPEMFRYMGPRPWQDLADVLVFIESFARSNSGTMLYVIHDKKDTSGRLAGIIGYMNSSAVNLVTELGFVFILPHAQRTHILTHSASLLFDNAFNLPSQAGLGLRRVQWQAHGSNLASVKAAERLGFVNETPLSLRAERVVPQGKEAPHPGRAGDGKFEAGVKSRDSFMLSITYWEWEESKREKMKALVERK